MANDAEFRARFLHESRAAAAVDSPVFEQTGSALLFSLAMLGPALA